MDPPVCSICIANYNGAQILPDCLESIQNQDFNLPVEIILHDDASTDDSVALIRDRYPFVQLLTSDENVGFCISNNRMAQAARGKYLLLLNNDAALRQGALEALYQFAKSQNGDGILSLPQFDMATGKLLDMGSRLDPFLNPIPNLSTERTQVPMVMGACLWCPKELWETIGGFPEWFGSLAEDMYLCLYAWNLGSKVQVVPASGYNHRVGESLGGGKILENALSSTYRRRALSERNKTYVMLLFYPTAILAAVLPFHATFLAVEATFLCVAKRSTKPWREIYLPAFLNVWRSRETIRALRETIQSARKLSAFRFLSLLTIFPHKLRMLLRYGVPRIS